MVIKNRNSEISPKPKVYVGLNVFICVLAPWIWKKKVLTIMADLDLSEVGMPLLKQEFINELKMFLILSMNSFIPDRLGAFIFPPKNKIVLRFYKTSAGLSAGSPHSSDKLRGIQI